MRDEECFNDDGRYEPPPLTWFGCLAWLVAAAGVGSGIVAVLGLTARFG